MDGMAPNVENARCATTGSTAPFTKCQDRTRRPRCREAALCTQRSLRIRRLGEDRKRHGHEFDEGRPKLKDTLQHAAVRHCCSVEATSSLGGQADFHIGHRMPMPES